ncbi:MAG: hypothetical protein SGILL_005402, partial [Bacillariaceae sp.]
TISPPTADDTAGKNHPHRQIQRASRKCNEAFDFVTTIEIESIFNVLLERATGLEGRLEQDLLQPVYNVTASKVCLKCSEMGLQDLSAAALMNPSKNGFPSYCNMDEYGWEATHSAIILHPVDEATGNILSGELRGVIVGHDTAINVNGGPTDLWPVSGLSSLVTNDSLMDDENLKLLESFVTALAGASAGAVVILPDYIGYGESKDFDRVFLQPLPYLQAGTVTYAAAKRYVAKISIECTHLVDVATLTGYGEGGYFAMVAALALQQNGVEILSVHAGATPFDLDTQLVHSFGALESNNGTTVPTACESFRAYFGYSYSNEFSFMANTESNQYALSSEWMNVVDWFNNGSDTLSTSEILERIPSDQKQMFNEALTILYDEAKFEGLSSPCRDESLVTEPASLLCSAILDASLWKILTTTTIPVSICHSPEDEVIGFENLPDPTTLPPNVRFYSNEIGALNPRGSHEEAMFLCALDHLVRVADSNPEDAVTSPVYRKPLAQIPDHCSPLADELDEPVSCSSLFERCHDTERVCCPGLVCEDRMVDGGTVSVCVPGIKKDDSRSSLAFGGAGGADRGGM